MDVADDGEYLTPDPPFAVHCALLSYRQGKDPVVVYSAHGEPGSAKTTRCISHRMSQKMIVFFFLSAGDRIKYTMGYALGEVSERLAWLQAHAKRTGQVGELFNFVVISILKQFCFHCCT